MPTSSFTDRSQVAALYTNADRLARRTGALHAAKISGADATTTITEIAARLTLPGSVVSDIGCGRGTTTLALAARLAPRRLIALDRSPALLATVRQRAADAGHPVHTVGADFHHLPLPPGRLDLAVAAFCLYHSADPERVVAEIARCLTPGGHAVLVTKSGDSYHEIDQLVRDTGLDPDATARPSLYATFHSDNVADITATALRVVDVVYQQHVFRFTGREHLAAYLTTSPRLGTLTDEHRRRLPDTPLTATSTVTYIAAAAT